MQISLEPKIELRSKIARIAAAVGFAFVIGSFGVGSARAADNHGGNYHGGDQHHDNGNHGGGYRGPAVVYAQPDYYYAPQPDYYAQPEPYNYYDDSPEYPAAPPQGVTLFFGL
jgi:hypothetical protein